VRDPYEILGVKRGASRDEIRAAFRRKAKELHPDHGGPNEEMVELNTAYAFILNQMKEEAKRQQNEEAKQRQTGGTGEGAWRDVHEDATHDAQRDTYWRNIYRDIDDELEALRRAAEQYDEQLRRMRSAAWATGQHAAWARLTWDDFFAFLTRTARSGVKGLALIFAALVGVGTVLVEANFISALILLGGALGFAFSLAMKSDKGGVLSAALLLFGVMTIWLPPVRNALFLFPLATISVLVLLALIFKFAQAGGTVGLMTGGVLAIYIITVILGDTAQRPQVVRIPPPDAPVPPVLRSAPPSAPAPAPPAPQFAPSAPGQVQPAERPVLAPSPPPAPPEPRTLLASQGAILKFVAGVPYHLKVRAGFATSLRATQGRVALGDIGECVDAFDFPMQSGAGPWLEIDRTLHACNDDAIMSVTAVR
jgi:hypothetical protein